MSLVPARAGQLRRPGSVAAIALSAIVIPLAVACESNGDSGAGTTVQQTVTAAPPAATTPAEPVPAEPTTTSADQVTSETDPSSTTPEGAGPGFIWLAQSSDGSLRPSASLATTPSDVADAIAAGSDDPDLVGGLPPGTAVQGVSQNGSVVSVDLTSDFEIGYQPSSAAETVAVAPLVYSLTELPGVESVEITVDGAVPMPVGASFDFSNPLSRADIPATFAEGFG